MEYHFYVIRKNIKTFLIFVVLFILIASLDAFEFQIEKKLPPLKMKYSEFIEIVDDLNHLIKQADSVYNENKQFVTIETDETSQTLTKFRDIKKYELDKAYKIIYRYKNYNGIIESVSIDFSDYSRNISISGSDYILIQTISSDLYKKFCQYRNYIGGNLVRAIMWIFCFALSWFLWLNLTLRKSVDGKIEVVVANSKIRMWFGAIMLIFSFLILWGIIKINNIFSGFIIFESNMNFILRYSDHFTFWGFLVSVFALLTSNFFKKQPSSNENKHNSTGS